MHWSANRLGRGFAVVALVAVIAGIPAVAAADDQPPDTTSTTAVTPPEPTTTAPSPTSSPTTTTTTIPSPESSAAPADGGAGAEASATATVSPSTGLVNGQTVTVTGAGFAANASIGGAVCNDVGDGADACDTANVLLTTADPSGAFTVQFTVRRILHTANGTVDCASAAQVCHLGVANIQNQQAEHANIPLGFDTTAPLPPPPTLLAGPTTGLVEGSTMALFGAKFVPNADVYFSQCVQPVSQSSCTFLGSVTADGNGGFITTTAVHRVVVQPPFLSVDCATAPDTCLLVATSAADVDVTTSVGLSFDPNGPAPSETVTITPDTNLVHHQSVTVAGAGFTPGGFANAIECKTGATTQADCNTQGTGIAPVAADGTFSGPFTVRRILNLPAGDFDCATAPGACSIVTTAFSQTPVVVSTAISFDPNVPPPPPPTITVVPSTDLVDRQSLTVSGTNFAPDAFVNLNECPTTSTSDPYCSPFGLGGFAQTDSTGSFTTTVTARRGIRTFNSSEPVVDCASSSELCSLFAASEDGDVAHAVLDFDPNAPIPTTTVTVTPDRDLPDRAVVTVHGSGFGPDDSVFVTECAADAAQQSSFFGCGQGPISSINVDSSGSFDYTLRVHRDIAGFGPTPVNCAASFGTCVVQVTSIGDPFSDNAAPIGFDPTAVAPGPTITITPAEPYADGQRVTVHGSGFTPDATLGLAQCVAGSDYAAKTCDSTSHAEGSSADGPGGQGTQGGGLFDEFRADGNGEFTRDITLHTSFQTIDHTVDCLTEPSGCVLFAANRDDYGAERTAVPLVFAGTIVTPARALAFTGAGSDTRPLAIGGVAAILLGLALIALQRRRPGSES